MATRFRRARAGNPRSLASRLRRSAAPTSSASPRSLALGLADRSRGRRRRVWVGRGEFSSDWRRAFAPWNEYRSDLSLPHDLERPPPAGVGGEMGQVAQEDA